jgi:hypothetical protein
MTMDTITVPELYVGYPGVAFGGYVAGVLAERTAARTARVDFRGPVPVGTAVPVAGTDAGGALLGAPERPLATLSPAGDVPGAPAAPSWEEAAAAAEAFRSAPPAGLVDCFGCGLDRSSERGLRQHCAPVPGREVVACGWVASPALAGSDGLLPSRLMWGALDCPGNWAGRMLGTQAPGAVTAALTGTLLRPATAGERLISYAWLVAESGRKHTVGVALAAEDGELCAVGEALWLDPAS